jgi:hypothetical protein
MGGDMRLAWKKGAAKYRREMGTGIPEEGKPVFVYQNGLSKNCLHLFKEDDLPSFAEEMKIPVRVKIGNRNYTIGSTRKTLVVCIGVVYVSATSHNLRIIRSLDGLELYNRFYRSRACGHNRAVQRHVWLFW